MDSTLVFAAIQQSGEAASGSGSWQLLALYALLALGVSFLCSVAEAVLLSVTPSFVAFLEQQNKTSGRLLGRLKRNIDRPLAAILSLNTIAHTAGAAGVGAEAARILGSKSVGIVSAILTLLILILSEIIPKTIGSVYWRKLAPLTACGVHFFTMCLYPLVILSEQITRLIAPGGKAKSFSREEFGALASIGAEEGHLAKSEYRILGNLLRFRSHKVHEVMTPRTVAFALQETVTVGYVFRKYTNIPFSRIPVYRENLDDVTGFVLKNDIVLSKAEGRTETPLYEFKRSLKAIPESASLFNAFELLLDQREHIALVVDEYGGVEGIVTLEDLVETLFGLEIVDEADVTVDMRELAKARWEKQAQQFGIQQEDAEINGDAAEEAEEIEP
ncbi:MAG: CNNM domain-containing protein [Lentisphaeria bacterium]